MPLYARSIGICHRVRLCRSIDLGRAGAGVVRQLSTRRGGAGGRLFAAPQCFVMRSDVGPYPRPRERTCIAAWCRPRCGCGRRGPLLRGYARCRALAQREVARAGLRIAFMRATQPSRNLGGLGSSRPYVSRPALSRAAGRCTVRRHHRRRCDERHASPTLRAARPHAPRAAAHPRTMSIGAVIVDGETAL